MKKRLSTIVLACLLAVLLVGIPVLAATSATVTVVESSGNSYDMIGATTSMDNAYLAEHGFISATGLDVDMNSLPFMLASDRTIVATPLGANGSILIPYTTGNTPADAFYVLTGHNGYVTTPDDDTIELANNFEVEQKGWIDTSIASSAVTFQAAGAVSNAASGDVTPALPASWAANDIWLCLVSSLDNVNSTLPAGWTAIDAGTNNGAGLRTTLYWRRAVAGDTAPLVTHTAGAGISAVITGYRGAVTSGSPFDVNQSVFVKTPASTTNNFGAGATTTVNNCMIVLISGIGGQTLSATYTGTPTPTERVDAPNTASRPELVIADFPLATAGVTGARASTITSFLNNGYQLSLKPNNKDLVYKQDAFRTYISAAGEITSGVSKLGALSFDGVDDIVTVNAAASLANIFDGTGGSIEAWIKPDSGGEEDSGRVCDKGNGWVYWINYEAAGKAKIAFYLYRATTDGYWSSTATEVTIGAWNYMVVTYDADSVDNDPILYVNGSPVAITENGIPAGARVDDSAQTLYIGNNVVTNKTFEGIIDEVRLSTKIRSQAEITATWNSSFGIPFSVDGDTVALWHMNEGVGATIYDETANDNDGTITEAAWTYGFFDEFEVSVTAAGVSSGVHTIRTVASGGGTDLFQIWVGDGDAAPTLRQSVALGAATAPPNANDYTIMQNNSLSYMEYMTIDVASVEKLKYLPVSMISGTALIDETGSNDGTITWGSNPAGVAASIGALLPEIVITPATTVTDVPDLTPEFNPSVSSGVEGENFPFYGLFKSLMEEYHALGGPEITMPYFWKIIAVIIALVLGTATLVATRNILVGLGAYALFIAVPTAMGILDWYYIVWYIVGATAVALLVTKWTSSSI